MRLRALTFLTGSLRAHAASLILQYAGGRAQSRVPLPINVHTLRVKSKVLRVSLRDSALHLFRKESLQSKINHNAVYPTTTSPGHLHGPTCNGSSEHVLRILWRSWRLLLLHLVLRQRSLFDYRRRYTRLHPIRVPLRSTLHHDGPREPHLRRVRGRLSQPPHRSLGQWRPSADVRAGVQPARWAVWTIRQLPVSSSRPQLLCWICQRV